MNDTPSSMNESVVDGLFLDFTIATFTILLISTIVDEFVIKTSIPVQTRQSSFPKNVRTRTTLGLHYLKYVLIVIAY